MSHASIGPRAGGWLCLAGVVAACGLSVGCSRQAHLSLQQPAAPAYLRSVELTSDWAFYHAGGSRMAVLLSFPLPGVSDGPRDFHVYLELPDREGEIAAGPAPDGVTGFLIQEVGTLKGKAAIAGGRVRVKRPWTDPETRQIELDLRCTDETLVLGTACARPSASEIAAFERKRGADIAALRSDFDPATTDGVTGPRPAASRAADVPESPASE